MVSHCSASRLPSNIAGSQVKWNGTMKSQNCSAASAFE
jgi:hypothetical protein